MPLPMIGVLSFNGVAFDSSSSVRVREQYIKDPSGRTTSVQQITLDVDGWLAPIEADADVASLRVALSKQGGPLIYTGNGFPLVVNVPGRGDSISDTNFGPSPEVFEFEPKGGGTAARIKWSVTTWIPACSSTDGTFGSLQEFNYQVSWTKKPNGYTTRTISGHYKIPLGRFNGTTATRSVTTHADQYWESILNRFEIPAACRRSSNRTLMPDKATESFSITDEEIESENPFPLSVTNIQARHRVGWNFHGGGRIQNRLTATITMASGYDAGSAHFVFRNLCNQRLGAALDRAKESGGVLLIESMEGDEDLFGKSHSFGVGYRVTMKLPDSQSSDKNSTFIVLGEQFLTLSAFNGPIVNNSWDEWMASMVGNNQLAGPFGPRGTGSPALTGWGTDRIIDLCDGTQSGSGPFTRPNGFRPTFNSGGPGVWAADKPRPEASWLSYRHKWSRWGQETDLHRLRALGKFTERKENTDLTNGPIIKAFNNETFTDDKLKTFVSRGGGDTWLVQGSIERAIYKLPNIPVRIKLPDQKATLQLLDGYLESKQKTTPLGLKVNSGSFAAMYVCNKTLPEAPPDFSYP